MPTPSPLGQRNGRMQASDSSDVFWSMTPASMGEKGKGKEDASLPGSPTKEGREPLSPLENHSRRLRRTKGSPWRPNGVLLPEIDTESESWVDTDVEGSEIGDAKDAASES